MNSLSNFIWDSVTTYLGMLYHPLAFSLDANYRSKFLGKTRQNQNASWFFSMISYILLLFVLGVI